jgi:hypothetical protein
MSWLPGVFNWQNMQVRSIQHSALSSQPDRVPTTDMFPGDRRLSTECTNSLLILAKKIAILWWRLRVWKARGFKAQIFKARIFKAQIFEN